MTRDARLYLLLHKDCAPLVTLIETHKNCTLKDFVMVFDLSSDIPQNQYYAILSMSPEIDNIIEDYGGKEAASNDLLRNTLHDQTPIYGQKSRVVFLNKIS